MNEGSAYLITPVGSYRPLIPENFNDEYREMRQMVQDFARETLLPHAEEIEKLDEGLTRDLLKEMSQLGLMGADVPEKYGGMGLDKTASALVVEALAHCGSASLLVTYTDQTGIGLFPILWYGNEAQKEKYLPAILSGEKISSFALTEPGAGSDALATATTAVYDPEKRQFVINGTKQFITNGSWADLAVLYAKVDGQKFTAFVLEKDFPGWKRGPEEKKMGIKGSSTTTYVLEDCLVPEENVLGGVGKGVPVAFNVLYIGRMKLGAVTMGAAKVIIGSALEYARQRRQFGRPIAAFGMIQRKLADMTRRAFEAESITYACTGSIDAAIAALDEKAPDYQSRMLGIIEDHAVETSAVKVYCSETEWLNVDDAVQILGGYGYTEEYPFARYYRDEKINRIFEGTNEINRLIIGGTMLKKAILEEIPFRETIGERTKNPLPPLPNDMPKVIRELALPVEYSQTLVLLALDALIKAYGQDLKNRQFLLEPLADMALAQYVASSVVGRVAQVSEKDDRYALYLAAARISVEHQFHQIYQLGSRIWNHLQQEYPRVITSLGDVLGQKPDLTYDVLTDRYTLYRAVEASNGYPFE